jgi:Na+/H+ antiporter NhaC
MDFGFWSVIPSALAIALALLTKNVFLALLTSLLVGNLMLADGNVLLMLSSTKDMLVNVFQSPSSTSIIFILAMLSGMFYLIDKSGGLRGFTALMIKKRSIVKSRVGAQMFAWIVGMLVFIDGTLSVMVAGSIARPLNRAFNISPEKTAWIVHSTATPLSILVPIAAYGPYIASFIEAQGIANPTMQMIRGIGFNFYCILAVFGVAFFILLQRDIGPMKKAENAYQKEHQTDIEALRDANDAETGKARHLLIPMGIMLAVTVLWILYSGSGNMLNGDVETALILGIFLACLYLIIDLAIVKVMKVDEGIGIFIEGCGNMMDILVIMILAYALSDMLNRLGTAGYLSNALTSVIPVAAFTAIVFIFTCVISFATGTSAGTIAITMPILLPMGTALGVAVPMVVGAIAGGAVFGDHTSPISDTTIMTASSTQCDVVSHVKTQLPYSLVFAGIATVIYLALGLVP